MSVVSVSELWNGRDGDYDISGEKTYSRVFRVVTDNKADEFTTVQASGSLPYVGNVYPNDANCFCQKVSGSQESFSPKVWLVTAAYSNKLEAAEDPTNDAAEIEWDTEQFQRPIFKDKDDNAIVNSAGDPYLPGIERDDSRRIVTITKNMTSVPSWILTFEDAVNDSSFVVDGITIGARKAKCQKTSVGKWQERNGTEYRQVQIVLHLRKDTWDFEVMDTGLRRKDGNDRKVILNDDGTEITSPVPLDGSGDALTDPSVSTVVYQTYRAYTELDFSSLPLA